MRNDMCKTEGGGAKKNLLVPRGKRGHSRGDVQPTSGSPMRGEVNTGKKTNVDTHKSGTTKIW